MPEIQSTTPEYNQDSFLGGMNLLGDDSRLATNQYRVGFNVRNRFDRLDPVLSSKEDTQAPIGIKQEMVTFGNYEILFVAGLAYYKHYAINNWTQIVGFKMSTDAPRFWTCPVPVTTTNYVRIAATKQVNGAGPNFADSRGIVSLNNIAGAAAGDIPGLLVQDNINQPQFIFLDGNGFPTVKTTQKFEEWGITFTNADNIIIAPDGDKREYVPIGNSMAWVDGVLYIASPDGNFILRSVSGRPLDFVINVSNLLVTVAPFTQAPGGDAYTTAYSVGVGGIKVLRTLSDGSLFVGASNANFSVAKDMSNVAVKEFGEYSLRRIFLFNAICLSDRAIFDSIGDTRFISLTGIRSFNAISQTQNEGRNSPFSSKIRSVFGPEDSPIIQDFNNTACILFNDYELYAIDTTFGPAIAVYDTLNQCWSGFDTSQTGGKRVKQFAKIELTNQLVYAITEDDKLYQLYVGPGIDDSEFRTLGVCAGIMYAGQNVRLAAPKNEVKLANVRVILNRIIADGECDLTVHVNNRQSAHGVDSKVIKYTDPINPSTDAKKLDDEDTMLTNICYATPDAEQGWKVFCVFKWNTGSITQFSIECIDVTPMNPLNSQDIDSQENTSV